MSAQIRSQINREIFRNLKSDTISFYVYDASSEHAGTAYDYAAWRFLGNASVYTPQIGGDLQPVIITPNTLPMGYEFPQVHVHNLRQATAFYQAYAEVYIERAAIQAERDSWTETMREAEAAEARARAILSDSPAVPPF